MKLVIILSPEEEKKFWERGVLNLSTPTGLLQAEFSIMGKLL